jgi:hypothetical protein
MGASSRPVSTVSQVTGKPTQYKRAPLVEYKKVDGVLVPTKQVVKAKSGGGSWDIRQVLHFESVTFNDVDPAVFTPPEAVRELLKNGKPGTPDGSQHL